MNTHYQSFGSFQALCTFAAHPGDETQLRCRGDQWKRKTEPGSSSRFARQHQADAVKTGEAFFSQEVRTRRCDPKTASALLQAIRPTASAPLTGGDLHSLQFALQMLDAAMGTGSKLDSETACALVMAALKQPAIEEGDEMLKRVRYAGAIIQTKQLDVAKAWDRSGCFTTRGASGTDEVDAETQTVVLHPKKPARDSKGGSSSSR